MSAYHIWAWIDPTSEDFVAVVAAVPENNEDTEVISVSEISPDERAARLRLEVLVTRLKANILARGGEVLDVTMQKMPAHRGALPRGAASQDELLVIAEVADAHRRDRVPCGFHALAHRLGHRQSRHGLIQRRGGRRFNKLGGAPLHRHRD